MKLLVLARGRAGDAEKWAVELQDKLGIATGGLSFVIDGSERKIQRSRVVAGFAQLADAIEQAMADDVVFRRSRIILVGSAVDAGPHPIPTGLIATDATYWLNLVALLVLTFPDIHWVFSTTAAEDKAMRAVGLELHSLPDGDDKRLRYIIELRDDGHEPLFDPTGLRNLIKRQSYARLDILPKVKGAPESPDRAQLALILDDEVEIAAAMAYLHYRQGYRALIATSELQMSRAKRAGAIARSAESFTIEFLDASAGFQHLRPIRRPTLLPALADVPTHARIVYTIDDLTDETRSDCAGVHVIRSPFDGMPDLLLQLGLDQPPRNFVWPPAHNERGHTAGRHAMRGFMTAAARHLLRRSAEPGYPAYRQALFALEAQELLLNRLPSLSLQAQQQRLREELRVEDEAPTLFGGSSKAARLRLQPRFDEIGGEINSMLAVIFNPDGGRRDQLKHAFEAQLVGGMVDEYRRGYHFHEELATIARKRENDMRGAGRYIAMVLRRPVNFVAAVLAWVVLFAVIYAVVAVCHKQPLSVALVAHSSLVSLYTMASVGLPPNEMLGLSLSADWPTYQLCGTLECITGLIHWALGFAHLYTLVSRR